MVNIIKRLLIHWAVVLIISYICYGLYLLALYIKRKLNISDRIFAAILFILSSLIAIIVNNWSYFEIKDINCAIKSFIIALFCSKKVGIEIIKLMIVIKSDVVNCFLLFTVNANSGLSLITSWDSSSNLAVIELGRVEVLYCLYNSMVLEFNSFHVKNFNSA